MLLKNNVKVKVKIHPCSFSYCAEFYSDDADKVLEAIEKARKDIINVMPLFDDVFIEPYVLGFSIGKYELTKGIVGYTDAAILKTNGLDEFINTIKSILNEKGIKYKIEVSK